MLHRRVSRGAHRVSVNANSYRRNRNPPPNVDGEGDGLLPKVVEVHPTGDGFPPSRERRRWGIWVGRRACGASVVRVESPEPETGADTSGISGGQEIGELHGFVRQRECLREAWRSPVDQRGRHRDGGWRLGTADDRTGEDGRGQPELRGHGRAAAEVRRVRGRGDGHRGRLRHLGRSGRPGPERGGVYGRHRLRQAVPASQHHRDEERDTGAEEALRLLRPRHRVGGRHGDRGRGRHLLHQRAAGELHRPQHGRHLLPVAALRGPSPGHVRLVAASGRPQSRRPGRRPGDSDKERRAADRGRRQRRLPVGPLQEGGRRPATSSASAASTTAGRTPAASSAAART